MAANILTPGYLRWDGTKFTTDPTVEIVGPPGPPGTPGAPGGSQTLAQTLALGNSTGGHSVLVTSGDLFIGEAAGVGSNNTGGSVPIVAGAGDGTGNGGVVLIWGGAGGSSGDGGNVTVLGGSTSGATGGSVQLYGGTGTLSSGGVSILNSDASTPLIVANKSIFITGFSRSDNIDAGLVSIAGGTVTSGTGNGGDVRISAGPSPFSNGTLSIRDANGNDKIQITPGNQILFYDNVLFAQQSTDRTIGWRDVGVGDGFSLIVTAQNGNTINNGGNISLLPGSKGASGTADGNMSLLTTASGYGGMSKGIFIGNVTTAPISDPTGGGFLYVEAGALKYRGSSGTITTVGPA